MTDQVWAHSGWPQGWFSCIDNELGREMWRPCLQLDGIAPGLQIWFNTEAESDEWIRDNVIGKDLWSVDAQRIETENE